MQHQTFNGDVGTQSSLPYLMGEELKKNYQGDFKYITMATWMHDRIISFGEKTITKSDNFFEPQVTEILSLKMIKGTRATMKDNQSVILSESTAKALFGDADPMNKIIKIDNCFNVKVSGVYEDIPYNSDFKNLEFMASWQMFTDNNIWLEKATNPWRNNSFQAFVQLADNGGYAKGFSKNKRCEAGECDTGRCRI